MPVPVSAKLWNKPLKRDGGTGQSKLSIDGSVTPVEFVLLSDPDVDLIVQSMCLIAEFTGSIAIGDKFLMDALSTLSNGLFIEAQMNGESFNFGNLKRTRDVVEMSQPQGGFNTIVGTTSLWQVFFYLPQFSQVSKDSTDYVKVTVRDDLSDIDFMEIFLQGVKV